MNNGMTAETCAEGGQDLGYVDPGDYLVWNSIAIPTTGSYLIELLPKLGPRQYSLTVRRLSLITLAVICCFLAAAAQLVPPRVGFVAFASGLMAWLASFLITSYMQAV